MMRAADYVEVKVRGADDALVVFSDKPELVVFQGNLPEALVFRDFFVGNLDRIITQAKGE